MRKHAPWIVACSLLLYRWLLRLGPDEFYNEYAVPALQVFRQCCLDAYRQHGPNGVLRLWPSTLIDTLKGVLAEQSSAFKPIARPYLLWLLALALTCVLFPFYWLSKTWAPFGYLFRLVFTTSQAYMLGHVALFCLAGLSLLLSMPALRKRPQFYTLCLMAGAFAEEAIQALFHSHPGIHGNVRDFLLDLCGILLAYLLLRLWLHLSSRKMPGFL